MISLAVCGRVLNCIIVCLVFWYITRMISNYPKCLNHNDIYMND